MKETKQKNEQIMSVMQSKRSQERNLNKKIIKNIKMKVNGIMDKSKHKKHRQV